MQATFTIQITTQGPSFTAVANFPAGLFHARRPIIGTPAATKQAAIASLLASPKLHITLAAIASN